MVRHQILDPIQHFLGKEYASGILLFVAALLAMIAENSGFSELYDSLLGTAVEVRIGEFQIAKPMLLWVNDGLMAIFFFHVGLEIKREVLAGKLTTISAIAFPFCGAMGGIAVPALFYVMINLGDPQALQGWAIPTATDIAFALGVLALLGNRVPAGLKVFLLSLAVIDDLCAILIIAFFYTSSLSGSSLIFAAIMICILYILNRMKVCSLVPYLFIGLVLWACVLKSGIHATLAGVIVAMFIPHIKRPDSGVNLLEELEHDLKGFVYLTILPFFAFVNSGVYLGGLSIDSLLRPIPMGIVAGLLLGKQLGIFAFSWLAVKTGLAKLPEDISWKQLYGVALICGIGFTMSLFISSLAFQSGDMTNMIDDRLGIIAGSLLSGIAGYCFLRMSAKNNSV
ncbi:MAG: NhaA family Na+:H+ antiporter [Pseudohongiellaceae bacterium]|mgnify:CR=1 FL=1|jgi:NhaA family Na+:H+ antiporter|tara:strand:+ start:61 stop:1251 length:1191 start_codon:yes stop_codon:yes gene_type:complete